MKRTTEGDQITGGVKKAIVRAVTAAEIAANFAIRKEFAGTNLSAEFVNDLMKWANGLSGKIDRLLIPISANSKSKVKKMKALKGLAKKVADKRNAIAHQGEICNEVEAKAAIGHAREFITGLVGIYDSSFRLTNGKG